MFFVEKNSFDNAACKLNAILNTIGIFINIMCMYIFMQKKLLKFKFNWYLLALSVIELLFCLLLSIDYIFHELSFQSILLHDFNSFTKSAFDFAIHTTDSYTIVLTLLLSIDRFNACSKPLKTKYLITNVYAKSLIGFSFVLLLLLKTPSFVFCELKSSNCSTSTICYCTLVSPLIFNIIPMLAILILNLLLIIKIIKSKKSSDFLRIFHSKQNSKRYLVILNTALWCILTSTPYYILSTYSLQQKFNLNLFYIELKTARVAQIIFSILFNSNHFINFFIYLGFHREFKECFYKKICCIKKMVEVRRIRSDRRMQTAL